THDPRPSIEERYPSRDQYLKQVQEAAASLVKDVYVLAEDVPAIVKHAGDHRDLLVKRPSSTSTRAERSKAARPQWNYFFAFSSIHAYNRCMPRRSAPRP